MTDDLQQARIEAAAEYLYDWQTGSVGYFHTSNHKELWVHGARQALAAADAVVTVEQVVEELQHQLMLGGFYIDQHELRTIATAMLALIRGGRGIT